MKVLLTGLSLAAFALLGSCSVGSKVITLDEYNQVAEGMTYSQVTAIIGESGTESSSSTMPEVPGVMEAIDTKVYTWQNPDGSNMLATFQNDSLVNKAQAGL